MNNLMIYGFIALALMGGAIFFYRAIRGSGEDRANLKTIKKTIKDISDAKKIRDRLRTDKRFADRVRDKFRR